MFLFGKMKSVATIEKERLQLGEDFQTYTEVETSKKLKEFLALKEKVESTSFKAKKKEIESLRYKGSAEEKMVKQFARLEKNAKLISFYKVNGSPELDRFNKMVASELPRKMKELEAFMKSGKYKKELKLFNQKKRKDKTFNESWESTNAYKMMLEYGKLKNSPDYIFYKQFSISSGYKNYLSLEGSSFLNQYQNLKEEVTSDKFKERKLYLEDINRYQKTEDYQLLVKYDELKSDEGIKLFFTYKDTDAFRFFREWVPTFEDNFNTPLNKSSWEYITPIAEKGPGKNFSVDGQLQYYDLAKNFRCDNNILTLDTRDEKIEGLFWDQDFGFVVREFNYVSGVIHSLGFFMQEYGQFEVKLKASKIKGVISSVSLVDEDEEICIRVVSLESNKASGGVIYTEHGKKVYSKINLNFKPAGYVIVGVEWSPEKIEWKVNDKPVGSLSQNIPHEKLGLRIETEVLKQTSNLPHRLDIDWIRCYKKNS